MKNLLILLIAGLCSSCFYGEHLKVEEVRITKIKNEKVKEVLVRDGASVWANCIPLKTCTNIKVGDRVECKHVVRPWTDRLVCSPAYPRGPSGAYLHDGE